jgi:putative DNA primase/helicase
MARKAMSRHPLSAALELAKGLLLADPSEFDRDPFALNCLNGTVDLRTGELRPHNPADRITKLAPVEYDPDAPTWQRFLNDIFLGDQELVAYVQRALGYSITGDTREDCVFIAWGPGRNGKSVFLETVAAVVGDYARSMPPDLILARGAKDDTHPHVLAELAGVRLATISETEEERRLNASRLKALSGRDTLTARHLYRPAPIFEFEPTAKLWLVANHKPVVRVSDYSAMWRAHPAGSLQGVTIPEGEQGPPLAGEAAGRVGRHLARGLIGRATGVAGQRVGPPPAVRRATDEYRREHGYLLGEWLDESAPSP